MKRRNFFGRILAAFGVVAADKVIARTYKKPMPTPTYTKPFVSVTGSRTPTVSSSINTSITSSVTPSSTPPPQKTRWNTEGGYYEEYDGGWFRMFNK